VFYTILSAFLLYCSYGNYVLIVVGVLSVIRIRLQRLERLHRCSVYNMTFPILAILDIWALFILRVVLGLIFTAHGLAKVRNLKANAESFTGMGFKPGMFWGTLVGLTETISGIALILGFFTQVAAALVGLVMIVAIVWKIIRKMSFNKMEIDLILLASAFTILILGGGAYALDMFLPTLLI
jgi:putative oxidoreductase